MYTFHKDRRNTIRARWRNIGNMVLSWIVAGNLFYVFRLIGIEETDNVRLVEPINFVMSTFEATLSGTLIGLIFGAVDILLERRSLRRKSFGFIIFIRSVIFVVTLFLTIGFVFILSQSIFNHLTKTQALHALWAFYISKTFWVVMLYGSITTLLINFIKQVSRKFGPGNLIKLLKGIYHTPREEERIFMFLDLKSSTSHAETLGHLRYSQLIQDCFYDLTDIVVRNKAEIYQYVGDEAVLTWTLQEGLEEAHCIRTYFDYAELLGSKARYYREKYGLVPEFKAGVNLGRVMAVEVGEIKREIAYHGDVLNTAARIQGKCNELNQPILISDYVKEKLARRTDTRSELLGRVPLRGKQLPLPIYSVAIQ